MLQQFTPTTVWGVHPKDVKDMAPPNSYIHADNFKSPVDLVRHLEYLNKNDTAYMEYHQWLGYTCF